MESPKITGRQSRNFHYQVKPPMPGRDYIWLSSWSKGPHGKFPHMQGIARATGYSPQTDGKSYYLRQHLLIIEHREVKRVHTAFTPTDEHSWHWKKHCTLPEGKDKPSATNPEIHNSWPADTIHWGNNDTSWENDQPTLSELKAHSMKQNSCSTLLRCPRI